jgi:DNA-directed RNA polymerase subunit beta'
VKKPETINYRTFKPERDGLFCERIFGPVKDWECHCGRYKKVKFKGHICERCGVEVTRSKVRRERMGHIELAAPVCHIWYLKGVPSPLSLILDISPRPLEKVLYFASYIVTYVDRPLININLEIIRQAVEQEVQHIESDRSEIGSRLEQDFRVEVESHTAEDLSEEEGRWTEEDIAAKQKQLLERIKQEEKEAAERIDEIQASQLLLEKIEKRQLITEDQWRALERLMEVLTRRTGDSFDGVVRAGLGGAAIKELLEEVDIDLLARELRNEVQSTQGPKRIRAIKRLEVAEAFISSKAHPSWMILDCIPVISPELRPMVQLDGGRFATSDLNDLYRRIINRNNRLKKITEIRAPESIVNHEKRLLQEAVDALIDNGRRTRPVVGSNNRPLKSLSDMLKGKEGRFRKNLLGKRVDYSGRSVIVVGPHLKLHQCGLPKEMALELFKPFVMKNLCETKPNRAAYTSNIKTAKRMIDKMRPEVWDALEEVIREHPVMLNRAPTLHRLGIQAFEPVLVDGKAIQLHPLVCHAFNADFDGDQMAVHVPLSAYAQAEARILMLSSHNLFSPANGKPIVAPIQDIVLGTYYLTTIQDNATPRSVVFSDPDEAFLAFHSGMIDLHEPIKVRVPCGDATAIVGDSTDISQQTTVGRLILNQILPINLRYTDKYLYQTMKKKSIEEMVTEVYAAGGKECVIKFLDEIKELGFRYAMSSGTTISMTDMVIPKKREIILKDTEKSVENLNKQYRRGTITLAERKSQVLNLWLDASEKVANAIMESVEHFNPINLITDSGARGSSKQLTQLSGMRGLMSDPFGNLIEDLPIKSNFHEGLNVLEYFISTHGTRKGLADTALRTADAGYLTRRLVDVSQDVIVRGDDCGTTNGVYVEEILEGGELLERLGERLRGRYPVEDIINPLWLRDHGPYVPSENGEDAYPEIVVEPISGTVTAADGGMPVVLTRANHDILDAVANYIDSIRIVVDNIVRKSDGAVVARKGDVLDVKETEALLEQGVLKESALRSADRLPAGLERDSILKPADSIYEITTSMRICVRSVLTCELRQGICAKCYGRDLATGNLVDIGVAVGIIAAQSIGEPGTQLTMRTFHTGGIAGKYLTGVANVKQKRQSTLRELHEDIRLGHVKFDEEGASERERVRSVHAVLKVLEDTVGGLLRVVELFEARKPKGQAIISEHGGEVLAIEQRGLRHVVINTTVPLDDPHVHLIGEIAGEDILNKDGTVVLEAGKPITESIYKREIHNVKDEITLRKTVLVPYRGELQVRPGETIQPGDRLTEGPLDPQKVLELQGPRGVQDYLVREIQSVYKGQGVDINDRHVEVIVRQMLKKRKVRHPGDAAFLPGQVVDKFVFEDENERVRKTEGTEATADWVLLGITEASLATDSFLSAASFQKTTRVLTEAAVRGKKDELIGLKENVIIGRLIPAGTGLPRYRSMEPATREGIQIIVETPREEKTLPLPTEEVLSPLEEAASKLSILQGDEEISEHISEIGQAMGYANILKALTDTSIDTGDEEDEDTDDYQIESSLIEPVNEAEELSEDNPLDIMETDSADDSNMESEK